MSVIPSVSLSDKDRELPSLLPSRKPFVPKEGTAHPRDGRLLHRNGRVSGLRVGTVADRTNQRVVVKDGVAHVGRVSGESMKLSRKTMERARSALSSAASASKTMRFVNANGRLDNRLDRPASTSTLTPPPPRPRRGVKAVAPCRHA
jgi:hypothetical protein